MDNFKLQHNNCESNIAELKRRVNELEENVELIGQALSVIIQSVPELQEMIKSSQDNYYYN